MIATRRDDDDQSLGAGNETPVDRARERQCRDLAATIATQAQAIADGTVIGPRHGAVRRLVSNVQTLVAWTDDDRSGAGSDPR